MAAKDKEISSFRKRKLKVGGNAGTNAGKST